MNIPSDLSFSSYNIDSEPQILPELDELDDIPEDDELHVLEAQQTAEDIQLDFQHSEDTREAIEDTARERQERLRKEGVVIQHTVPKGVSLGFRSDFEYPESPSKRYAQELPIDRSQFTDITFCPSSQVAHILPSSPPLVTASSPPPKKGEEIEEMEDNPFSIEEAEPPMDIEESNPFNMQDDSTASKSNGDSQLSNPFSMEAAEDEKANNPFTIIQNDANNNNNGNNKSYKTPAEENIYDRAYSHPFDIEENLDDITTPRLPPQTNISSKPIDKENQNPEDTPFTLEEADPTTPSIYTAPPTSLLQPTQSQPKPNAYTRTKVVSSTGETIYILQHPPNRLKIYRNSLVNSHRSEKERNDPLPRSERRFYGIDIYNLKERIKSEAETARLQAEADAAARELANKVQSLAITNSTTTKSTVSSSDKKNRKLLWTEKYRAKRFTDLLGDERTHRHILRWLKGWDSIVFGAAAGKKNDKSMLSEEQRSRRILLVTGPPGLGKTTMAHVLAKQAGYEPLEINASDDRTASVVKNRIKDVVGTNTVHMGDAKRGKPICVVIDEIDGVTGDGAGEGGFIKALVDLIEQDKRNSGDPDAQVMKRKGGKKGEKFRFLRPIIAVCNDLYAPSLKSLRPLCEIVYTKRPPLGLVLGRLKEIFEREGVEGDSDAIRRLVELEGGNGNISSADFMAEWSGDVRGVMVAGEWACGRLLSAAAKENLKEPAKTSTIGKGKGKEIPKIRMTKKWVEEEFSNGGGLGANDGASSGGRGNGVREVVERVFLEEDPSASSSFVSKSTNKTTTTTQQTLPSTSSKSRTIQKLRNLIESSGEFDKIMTDCFAKYPTHPFHDDPTLTKPNKAYEWIFMHDLLNAKVFGGSQDYELTPYLSTPLLGLHTLFATPAATTLKGRRAFGKKGGNNNNAGEEEEIIPPFSGAKADFEMREAQKATMSTLSQLIGILPYNLIRGFKPVETVAYELAPFLIQIIQPKVNPVLVGGKDGPGVASVRREVEKKMVGRAVEVLAECNVGFEKLRVEGDSMGRGGGWVFRMEPPFDALSNYKTFTQDTPTMTTRFAVRQVLDQELRKFTVLQQERIRQESEDGAGGDSGRSKKRKVVGVGEGAKIWCSFREGFSNAVKKPITWDELMAGL
ncbi:hypothetical protein TWF970_003636 [Orbilia oligospora]|uniref:AAA+ ATPase domain-containing protein n=1 Tax=Orbilia oligospora TaxID=2813651 RepID=A0A7C8VX43_ORBOL|nr:hypothetical protein TWF970_003636 [Orbilia oligospora]